MSEKTKHRVPALPTRPRNEKLSLIGRKFWQHVLNQFTLFPTIETRFSHFQFVGFFTPFATNINFHSDLHTCSIQRVS